MTDSRPATVVVQNPFRTVGKLCAGITFLCLLILPFVDAENRANITFGPASVLAGAIYIVGLSMIVVGLKLLSGRGQRGFYFVVLPMVLIGAAGCLGYLVVGIGKVAAMGDDGMLELESRMAIAQFGMLAGGFILSVVSTIGWWTYFRAKNSVKVSPLQTPP